MQHAHIFEAIMLICFGAAWPVSIYKTYRSRANGGKSVMFLFIILLGYINGVVYQYMISSTIDYIFYIFFINIILVTTDIMLYYRNEYLEKNGRS